jgi:hypothetical protein
MVTASRARYPACRLDRQRFCKLPLVLHSFAGVLGYTLVTPCWCPYPCFERPDNCLPIARIVHYFRSALNTVVRVFLFSATLELSVHQIVSSGGLQLLPQLPMRENRQPHVWMTNNRTPLNVAKNTHVMLRARKPAKRGKQGTEKHRGLQAGEKNLRQCQSSGPWLSIWLWQPAGRARCPHTMPRA